ncbi:hypothetical protein Acr_19g0000620 [Actinidia rufa]|uniref:Leucine-rich repeat-containing N-terminal plant-type domain-containing protein n=1 Tax=Actinidia rufa TaxID=165716 RepID=A0A7J0G8J2_9ERIC|nr:hypothetical protein Acr_19g0000620 [Actinidia rufa]
MEIRTLFLFLAAKLLMHNLVGCLSMTIPNITTDQSALLALKSSLILNPNSILVTNWTTRTSVCNWIGVVCGHRHKRVVALNIPSMGLVGTLPPSLGNLSFLVRINMFNNSFYGHLPEDLAKLRRLKYISVRVNNLGGQMPSWLGSLRNLQFLLLGNNNFTGKIPLEIGNLRDLRKLDTQFNQLTGTIPPHIFNISSLELIALSMNGLSGNLPADMCYDVPQLKFLYLSGNKLSGEVPPSLHRCSELEMLSLAINNFAGPITSGFGNLTKLEQLYLAKNHIEVEGDVPGEDISEQSLIEEAYLETLERDYSGGTYEQVPEERSKKRRDNKNCPRNKAQDQSSEAATTIVMAMRVFKGNRRCCVRRKTEGLYTDWRGVSRQKELLSDIGPVHSENCIRLAAIVCCIWYLFVAAVSPYLFDAYDLHLVFDCLDRQPVHMFEGASTSVGSAFTSVEVESPIEEGQVSQMLS